MLLSVQVPEWDGEGGVRILTQPERVGFKGRVEGWGRGGGV